MAEITHIRRVGLFTPDIEKHARFYTEVWGLETIASRDGAVYLRGSSEEYYVLSLHAGPAKGLHHVGYGVANESALQSIAQRLQSHGVRLLEQPGRLDTPGGGAGFRLIDPDGRCIE